MTTEEFRKKSSWWAVLNAECVVESAHRQLAQAYETLALARQLHEADRARLIGGGADLPGPVEPEGPKAR